MSKLYFLILLLLIVVPDVVVSVHKLPQLFDAPHACARGRTNDEEILFLRDEVTKIVLDMSKEDWLKLNETFTQDDLKAPAVFTNSKLNETFSFSTVKLRGKGSLGAGIRRSLTLKLFKNAKETPKSRLFGKISKVMLRSQPFDPTFVREFSLIETLKAMGACVQRASYAAVWVQSHFVGLYLMAESFDENFVQYHFAEDDDFAGALIKVNTMSLNNYMLNSVLDSRSALVKANTKNHGNDASTQQTPLINLMQALSDRSYENRFDYTGHLRQQAVLRVAGSMDDYVSNGNNQYIYFSSSTQRSTFIPYDLDLSLGCGLIGSSNISMQSYGTAYDTPHNWSQKALQRLAWEWERAAYSVYVEAAARLFLSNDFELLLNSTLDMLAPFLDLPIDAKYGDTEHQCNPTETSISECMRKAAISAYRFVYLRKQQKPMWCHPVVSLVRQLAEINLKVLEPAPSASTPPILAGIEVSADIVREIVLLFHYAYEHIDANTLKSQDLMIRMQSELGGDEFEKVLCTPVEDDAKHSGVGTLAFSCRGSTTEIGAYYVQWGEWRFPRERGFFYDH